VDAVADARESELRERVRAILAANRELGSRYEDAAVEQIVDLLQGRPAAKRAAPPPPPAPARGWHPLVVMAAVAALIVIGLPVLRVAVGVLTGVVDAFVWVLFGLACVYVIRLFKRWSRPVAYSRFDSWEDERGHRWRRVH
jgi:hypothetical protein